MSKVSKNVSVAKPKNAVKQYKSDVDGSVINKCVIVLGILCILSAIVFDVTQSYDGTALVVCGMIVVIGLAIYLAINKKLTTQNIILLLFAAGFILRLDYVLFTKLSETSRLRQHDVYDFGSGKGHSGYIEFFYENGFKLPDFDPTTKAQFYHPPLSHFLAALWMRLLTTFGASYSRAISSIQFLPLFYSSCCMIVCERLFSKLKIDGLGKILAVSIVVFHPEMILLSGSINNDCLSVLFTMLAVYHTVAWYQESTTKNILMIALSIGLGMSTKLSVALVAIPIAAVYLLKLIFEKKKAYEYLGQYCIFGLLCIPLGMWFYVRNFIKYKVSFTYVPRLGDASDQYLGNYSTYERLFDMSYHPFENIFLNRIATGAEYYEYNPFVSLIKTSIFGEYKYDKIPEFFCKTLLVLNVLMIAFSIATFVYCLIKKSNYLDNTMKVFFGGYQILLFANFISFCFKFPHNCSMDFRYIVPTMIIGAMFIGMFVNKLREDIDKKNTVHSIVTYGSIGLTSLFCIFSELVYILLAKK
ncbi:MAG: glycosyltransferase family 39 protein [Acutalibacteraceae bacterium]|nr:glycosyltransferase family 39 protein [Clostridia bacterium]MEE3449901.1 glycosyltransferase family 39 protein [Acutalibacteraceae bacterium]